MSRHKITISCPSPILYGSIGTMTAKCGKKNCACRLDKKQVHGPYYRWTGLIDGKRTGVTLSPELAKECQRRINNYKKLISKLDRILADSIKHAPWKKKRSSISTKGRPP